jgi:Cu-Zn family superoxide dismutase
MKKTLIILAAGLLAFGCAHTHLPTAMATLQPSTGQTAKGTVQFTDAGENGVDVQVDLTGVPPGTHGFHIHEKGDCGNNGANAGGTSIRQHGEWRTRAVSSCRRFRQRHCRRNGEVHAHHHASISLSSTEGTIRSVMVVLHEKADDLVTQPSGNAGARISRRDRTMTAGMHP